MVFTRIFNLVNSAQWDIGAHKMGVVGNEGNPFVILGHSYGTCAESLNCIICLIGVAFQYPS